MRCRGSGTAKKRGIARSRSHANCGHSRSVASTALRSPPSAANPVGSASTWAATAAASLISALVKAQFNKLNCADKDWKQAVGYTNEQWNVRGIQTVSCGLVGGTMYKFALDKAYVVGKDIASASATPSTTSTSWDVNLNFKGTGTKQFGDLTTRMYDKYTGSQAPPNWLGVVLDGVVVSAPYVQTPTTNGSTLIPATDSR